MAATSTVNATDVVNLPGAAVAALSGKALTSAHYPHEPQGCYTKLVTFELEEIEASITG